MSIPENCFNKKAELQQRWPRDAPNIYGCPEKFRESSLRTRLVGYFSRNLIRSILKMCVQNWKFAALPVP